MCVYGRLARANLTRDSDRGETSWQHPRPEWWHWGLACGQPALQSPGCSRGAGLHPGPGPSIHHLPQGRVAWERRHSGLCITRDMQSPPQTLLWEPSPLSHPPGPGPSHLSSRAHHHPPSAHAPLQQGLPEGWEDTVIIVPGGRQVGPARVGGVQAPRSLSYEGRGRGDKASVKPLHPSPALCPQRNRSLGQLKETQSQSPVPAPEPLAGPVRHGDP